MNKCEKCNGDGFTAEHDTPITHYDGECHSCPIQERCEECEGTGVSPSSNIPK